MKVIKHGNRLYYRETEHVCEVCGCKYAFNLADISYKIDYNSEEDKFIPCNYIVCPECKGIYILNQETESEEPAGGSSEAPTGDPSTDPTDPSGGD